MRSLLRTTLTVPECPKSVSKTAHIDGSTFKTTQYKYTLVCDETGKVISLFVDGYEVTNTNGCEGCPYKSIRGERLY